MHRALLSLLDLASDEVALGALLPLAEILLGEGCIRVVQGAQPVASLVLGFWYVGMSFHYNTDKTTYHSA